MTTQLPSRSAIENAAPLEFDRPRQEREVSITIEVSPAGLTVRADYIGSLSSIPQAIERLRSAGILELVSTVKPAAAPKGKSTKVQPEYNADGDPCCPKHHKVLKPGKFGMYCSAKDDSTENGYCSLKFLD